MQLRKFRTHLNGASNRKHHYSSQSICSGYPISSSKLKQPSLQEGLAYSCCKAYDYKVKEQSKQTKKIDVLKIHKGRFLMSMPLEQDPEFHKTQFKVKQAFRNRTNVKKIIKGCNLHLRGFISVQETQEIFRQKFGLLIDDKQVQKLISKYSKSVPGKLDTDDFLDMIFQSEKGGLLRSNLQGTMQSNQGLRNQIANLLDNVSNYLSQNYSTKMLKLRQSAYGFSETLNNSNNQNFINPTASSDCRSSILEHIRKWKRFRISQKVGFCHKENELDREVTMDQKYNKEKICPPIHKRVNSQNVLQQFIKDKKLQYNSQRRYSQSNGMTSEYHTSKKTKTFEIDPRSMIGVDQKKTRFGATPVLKFKDSNLQTLSISQKQEASQNLAVDRNLIKIRYHNKLAKIRQNRQNEKERIQSLNNKISRTEQANLQKRKLETQAYNYVAFIGNNWQ